MNGTLTDLRQRAERFDREAARLDGRANAFSISRLVVFVLAASVVVAGMVQGSPLLIGIGVVGFGVFLGLVIAHARVLSQKEEAEVRRDVHRRHEARMTARWTELPPPDEMLLPNDHPYARDIDLLGRGSLVQRMDVTHTIAGERALVNWLGSAASTEELAERQRAVRELAPSVELRQELEASAMGAAGQGKLDATPFLQFTRRSPLFARVPWLLGIIHVLPVVTVATVVGSAAGWLPVGLWLVPLVGQTLLVLATSRHPHEAFELVAARRGYVEAYARTLVVAETARFDSSWLQERQRRLTIGDRNPSSYLRRLDRWAGFAELRHQFPVHLVVNLLLLWDLHVLFRLERWARDVGPDVARVFEALGEIEAAAALATLAHVDADATMPELCTEDEPFRAEGLLHPLLPQETRVANDVTLSGPGTALIVTGSNMAGKSTLLRAVGVNLALALAGGPVIARSMRVPRVRLRASMRADDSLQAGASYFHAELTKLRRVIDEAEQSPPVFFLLDELLRGTNARARHLGARAVLLHLLERQAMGIVATHDVALAALEREHPERVGNVHFTDVMREGEMLFDYRLREGVVRTSNALRLLRQVGVSVPEDSGTGEDGTHRDDRQAG